MHVSVPLERFTFNANPANPPTFYEMGFSLNGNWGTNPASSNTQAASFYVDNMVLAEFDPVGPIDFNDNSMADLGDWALFMGQHLVASPSLGDLVGNFGASGTNGKNDFHDLLEFERLYDLANGGAGSLAVGFGTSTGADDPVAGPCGCGRPLDFRGQAAKTAISGACSRRSFQRPPQMRCLSRCVSDRIGLTIAFGSAIC